MDTNALQESRQIYREPRRRELILEARHSKSIEASNKIRSKLSPRLFMPRAPIYRHTTKPQHCPKELKSKFFKSQNLTTINKNTIDFAKESNLQKKCQNQNTPESFVKRLRAKFNKRSQRDQYLKTMENITDNNNKRTKPADRKRSKESKTDKNAAKRLKKQQDLNKLSKSYTKSTNSSEKWKTLNSFNTRKSKDEVKGKLGNLKIIANENSIDNTRYLTDGEIVFIEPKDQGEMYHCSRTESKKTVKATGTYYFESTYNGRNSEKSMEENLQRTTCDKSYDQGKSYDQNFQRSTDENQSKSQTKVCRHSKNSNSKSFLPTTTFNIDNSENSNKISLQKPPDYSSQKSDILIGLPTNVLENSKQNSTEIQNSGTSQAISNDSTCEKIRNYLNLQNTAKEYYTKHQLDEHFTQNHQLPLNDNRISQVPAQPTSTESTSLLNSTTTTIHYKPYLTHNDYSFERTIPVLYIQNIPVMTEEYNGPQIHSNFKETLNDHPGNSTKDDFNKTLPPITQQNSLPIPKPSKPSTLFKPYLTNNETSSKSTPIPSPPTSTTLQKTYTTPAENNSTGENSLLQLPLETYLNRASSAVADFQDTVHSSMSLIYDCSINDKNIHEDLINLENSVESFNKFLLQSYNDLQLMDLKTNDCVEYLNNKNINRRFQDLQLRTENSSLNKPTNSVETQETVTILIEADKMPIKTITFKTSDIICPKLNFSDNERSSTAQKRNLKRKNSDISIVSNIKLTNNDILNQIMPSLSTSPLNKEAAGNSISKRSSKESRITSKLTENPITSLQTFVEESMQKPVYLNKSGKSFDLLRDAEETNTFNEISHITNGNLNQNCSNHRFEDDQDHQNRLKHIGRKVTPRKSCEENFKISSSNSEKMVTEPTPAITQDTSICNEMSNRSNRNSKISRIAKNSITNPYNLIYTQAQSNYTSFAPHNPLRSYRIPNHLPRTITSQASSRNSVTLTNSYNYPRVNENSLADHHPSFSQIYRPYLYPCPPYANREHQVPNQNYSHYNAFYKPPNYIWNRERNQNSLHSMEVPYNSQYTKSVLNMQYLPNPYRYHHYPDLATYYRPYFNNNPTKFPPTHYPSSSRDFDRRHHSVFHTNSLIPPAPVQPFLNTD